MSPGHCLPPSSNIARHSTGDDKTTIATPVSGFLSHSLMSSVFPENARILLIISQERVPMVREVMERKLK
jgi:hypothetical protein